MVTLEIRRHAERAREGDAHGGLSASGAAMARALRPDAQRFALVVSSPHHRARETAVAMAGRVDETAEILGGSPDEALTQERYDAMRSQEDVIELLGTQPASRRFAQEQLAFWEAIACRLADGERALVITHGGNVELPAALLARRLGLGIGRLPLSYCEGVSVEYANGRWTALARLDPELDRVPAAAEEIPLGGNLSGSVRIGGTVRRRSGPWTPAVHALLRHVRESGFGAAPEPLGSDEQGRAVLAFIPGETHEGWPEPMPAWMYEDEATLVAAAELLRRYHDAVATFVPPADARWRQIAPGEHDLICHNDWAPYNALFRDHEPVVMLDWDSAGPGSRLWDAAGSAYAWVPLCPRSRELTLERKASRLARFCRAYGGELRPSAILEILPSQLRFGAEWIQTGADRGDPGLLKLARWNVPSRLREDAEGLVRQRPALVGGGD